MVYVKLLDPKLYGGIIGNIKLLIEKVRFSFYNQDSFHDEEYTKSGQMQLEVYGNEVQSMPITLFFKESTGMM